MMDDATVQQYTLASWSTATSSRPTRQPMPRRRAECGPVNRAAAARVSPAGGLNYTRCGRAATGVLSLARWLICPL